MLNCPSDPVEISLRRTSELTAQLILTSKVLVPEDDTIPERSSSSGSSAAWPNSCAPRWSESSAVTALICRYFRLFENKADRYGVKKISEFWAELNSKKGRCAARIVTFCPPALAIRLNGPGTANPPPPRWRFRALFCLGHLPHGPDRAALLAARQCVIRIARIANS